MVGHDVAHDRVRAAATYVEDWLALCAESIDVADAVAVLPEYRSALRTMRAWAFIRARIKSSRSLYSISQRLTQRWRSAGG